MDIPRWLDETVQPELPPSLPAQSGVETSVRPRKPEPVPRERHRRKPCKSDSSLLDPPLRERTLTEEQSPPTEPSVDDSADSETTQATHSESTESSITSPPYARKPRRKTRLDRYEPSSKAVQERGKHAYRNHKSESKPSRRKSKRKKCEKLRTGIVHSFHAKNVPGDRLTLKPREQLGIFNKGKTSMAVKGRGLPDLVFSEMKFLQNQKDQPEPTPQAGIPKKKKKKRKTDHAHTKEGEISAFFTTTVRPALAEKDGNNENKDSGQTLPPEASRRERERSLVVDAALPAIPTIERPDNASYLGFGSRGPHYQSTSGGSWSESIRAPSTMPSHLRTKPVAHSNQLDAVLGGEEGISTGHKKTSFKQPEVPSFVRQGTNGTSDRFGVSSLAPSRHRVSRSQSFPQRASSPQLVNLVDRAAKFQGTDTMGSPSSMPPVVPVRARVDAHQVGVAVSSKAPRSRATSPSGTINSTVHRQPTLHSEGDNGDIDPQTSSDLGRVLQECNSTFYQRRQTPPPHQRHAMQETPTLFAQEARQPVSPRSYFRTDRVPTVRFAGVNSCAPPLPNFAGPCIYEQQAQRQQLAIQPLVDENFLVDIGSIEQDLLEDDGVGHAHQGWEEQFEEPLCHESRGDFRTYNVEEMIVPEDSRLEYDVEIVQQFTPRPVVELLSIRHMSCVIL